MKEPTIEIPQSDAQKILDVLKENEVFHRKRDEMNSTLHLAKQVRHSPLTTETITAVERLQKIMEEEILNHE